MKKSVLLIDAGYLKQALKYNRYFADKNSIVKLAHACFLKGKEELHKVLYYDCAPFIPDNNNPLYINPTTNNRLTNHTNNLTKDLSQEDLFAIRLGKLKFRGWVSKNDTHEPDFQQKGVDMKIGLDIASLSHLGTIDRIILLTGDTDFIPAMKYARKLGVQIVLIRLENSHFAHELIAHTDFLRKVKLSNLRLTPYRNNRKT